MFVETGHRYREGVMLTNLARIAMEQGRLDDALDGGFRALRLTEEIDDAEGVVASLHSIGDSHRLSGDAPAAREYLERGLRESRAPPAAVLHRPHPGLAGRRRSRRRTWSRTPSRTPPRPSRPPPAPTCRRPRRAPTWWPAWRGTPRATGLRPSSCGVAADRLALLGRRADRAECRAVLALALLDRGDTRAARLTIDEVIGELDDGVPPGIVLPGRVLVDVHRVLCALGDPRADDVARRAADWLLEQSARIRDDERRAGFLGTPVGAALTRIAATVPA